MDMIPVKWEIYVDRDTHIATFEYDGDGITVNIDNKYLEAKDMHQLGILLNMAYEKVEGGSSDRASESKSYSD